MRVLVTGGTGSFGRAFIAHLLKHDLAEHVVSMSRNATQRYALRQDIPDSRLQVLAGDVTDPKDLDDIPEIDTIVHAAAEKHIDTGERSPYWVRKNNVGGAMRVVDFALRRGLSRVLALSTDKACNPCNEYGSSKAQAELIFVKAGFSCVRYGNVINSSGSVLPLFIEQRKQGRLTVTDRRMTRYFMPLSDDAAMSVVQEPGSMPVMSAVGLVLYALEHMRGGEIFVPTIPSGRIQDLAEEIGRGCAIDEIGIRPGEKLHEELIHASESDRCWRSVDDVFVIMPTADDVPRRIPCNRVPVGFSYDSGQHPQRLRVFSPNEFRENQLCHVLR